jgi:hypothetical protein
MKKIKNIILGNVVVLFVVATALSSCSGFLDEDPKSVKTDEKFWKYESDAVSAISMLYYGGVPYLYNTGNNGWQPRRMMYNGLLSGLFTDDKKDGDFSANAEQLNITFQTVNSDVGEFYREPYVCIGRANVAIIRIPEMVTNGIITEDRKNELVAQAYFFRAWSYYYLIKEFGCKDGEAQDGGNGGVPLVLDLYDVPDPTLINQPRASISAVYQQIESDLLEAIKYLPNTTFYTNNCRITKPAAQTLLATVYLQWAGYPLQNTAMYEKAAQMAEAVITGASGHDLEKSDDDGTNQKSAFNKIKTSKTSKEIVYAIEFDQSLDRGNEFIKNCMTTEATSWKKADGKTNVFSAAVLSNMYHVSDPVIKSYVSGDVRVMEKNFFFQHYTSDEGITYNCNQYDNWFWFEDQGMITNKNSSLNFPVFRFADAYLIAAEALLKQSSPNQSKARGYLETVRKRAFTVNGVLSSSYSLPATITIDDVLTERLHEFPLELKVWDDIRRNRLYPQLQSDNTLKWVDISTADTYNKRDGKTFKNNQHMLIWPISQNAIERNPSLSQNPGY